MKLYIKNMVSLRCKMAVETCCNEIGLQFREIDLGEVDIVEASPLKLTEFKKILSRYGLMLLDNHKAILVEKIKVIIIDMVHYQKCLPTVNYSIYISKEIGKNYTYLANLFSEVKGITLEKYIILHKIEKVKELILDNELTMTQIANKLKYSNSAHLSNQFKKITGLTPSVFKKLKHKRVKLLEEL